MYFSELIFIPHPLAIRPDVIAKSLVVVIDVLRATTTMTTALQSGCSRIIPCATIPAARQQVCELAQKGESVFLAGEEAACL